MIDFILDVTGYQMQGTQQNFDSYIYATAAICIVVLFVVAAWIFVKLVTWIVGR